MDTIEKTGSIAAQERLEQREAEKLQITNEIKRLSAELAASQIELMPAAIEKKSLRNGAINLLQRKSQKIFNKKR